MESADRNLFSILHLKCGLHCAFCHETARHYCGYLLYLTLSTSKNVPKRGHSPCMQLSELCLQLWATIAQSVQRLPTGWTARGSNPGGGARFSAPVQNSPEAHPASYTMGTGSFLGVKQSERGVDHPPPI